MNRLPLDEMHVRAVTYQAGMDGRTAVSVNEREVREPATGEVRIVVAAAAVSPTDLLLKDTDWTDDETWRTPGMDAAGVIDAVGPDVSRLAVDDDVMAAVSPRRPDGGAQASAIVVPAASVVRKPRNVTFAEASTIPMNGLTALYALEIAALSEVQTLAVTGGAGWLSYFAIVLAKRRGLRVLADAKSADFDLVRSYGADFVVERGADFAGNVRSACPNGADALLDTALIGKSSFRAIADGGVYIPVRGWKGPDAIRDITIKPVMVPDVLRRTDWLEQLRELVEAGHIVPRVTAEFSPERVAEAHRLLEAGGVRGRPVILF